ncbi:MAG TPA: nucleotidyltransferase family protein [Acidobacteriaceae bacterium]|jgi:molybdenum cofactor cytidylyltransferase|nr:nucleotidyltransferase family protein [Acidobacteriaceae bacterium]
MDPLRVQRVAAVVLAAGASTRLGQAKQRVRVGGESLLHRTVRMAVEAGCSPVVAVLGFEAERMRPELEGLDAVAALHPGWAEGMGSSLRCGIEAVSRMEPLPDAVLVLVCDQPRLTVKHLRALLERHQSGRAGVTASAYAGRTGVPAVFAQALFGELRRLEGDRGARELIRSHAGQAKGIPWPEGTVDLDVPEDLRRID